MIKKGEYLYALVPEHPKATKNGYVLMHRIVMENHLGRLLEDDEVVHHKNGDKHDNRVENLEVMTNSKHSKFHAHNNVIEDDKSIRHTYEYYKAIYNKKIYPKCAYCGKECKHANSKYCSVECANMGQRKVKRPSKEELENLVKTKSFLEIGRIFGVSDNAIRKWCKYYGIPYRKNEINNNRP